MRRLSVAFLALFPLTLALPQPQTFCTAVCRPEKPQCPAGQQASGSEGCWGCCQPIRKTLDICTAVCRPEKPECPEGQAPAGQEGCWGCCEAVAVEDTAEETVCLAVCRPEKPECSEGEAPTGQEGCWGCCEPVA